MKHARAAGLACACLVLVHFNRPVKESLDRCLHAACDVESSRQLLFSVVRKHGSQDLEVFFAPPATAPPAHRGRAQEGLFAAFRDYTELVCQRDARIQ